MSQSDFDLSKAKVVVVGLGLIGGSLALGLRGKCAALYGIDPRPAALELALSQKIADFAQSDSAALAQADAILLAAPLPAILSWLEKLPTLVPQPCVVMDCGSSKRAVVEALDKLPERFDALGGHPICGKEKLGLENADARIFHNAPFAVTPCARTTTRAKSAARQIISALDANEIELDAAEHDRILAATSHLPFLLASALTLSVPSESAPFIGPGFKSASRLADTPSSMMLGVLQTNRENVRAALRRLQTELGRIETLLAADDFSALENLLQQSNAAYQHLAANLTPDT
ncbi:MAG: prephenate dehydrogenase/arogenate dehydrogenase family protein [Anaerolineales bacterium]|nr:prephenate dehydrogenase/arogenate dehydrogenase family protein [Anaerolineales bacterium]